MYFANEEHKKNYESLMSLYRLKHNQDVEYESSVYISAYPPIFDCFDNTISTEFSPIVYLSDEELAQEFGHNIAKLTGTTRRMVSFGMSLFNGSPVQLSDLSMLADEEFNVIMQAIAIRCKRQYIV
jgi:hypothetical protein